MPAARADADSHLVWLGTGYFSSDRIMLEIEVPDTVAHADRYLGDRFPGDDRRKVSI
jgi:hypothetical protein